jgi:mannose-6-phosphate isomerase-like protein (cupin superfamily)
VAKHHGQFMKTSQGYHLIKPEDLSWRPSNLMQIPNADYLERTGSEKMGARLWRLPPKSANTLHKHIRAEEFYFVLEGVGRIRIADETLTVPKNGGVLVESEQLRQVFNDTDSEVLWLIIGAPEELEFLQGSKSKMDLSLIYPVDPKQLPRELAGVEWPPKAAHFVLPATKSLDFKLHAEEWIAAWNSHDLERIIAHYSEDVELISPFVVKLTGRTDGAVRGKEALRNYVVRGLAAYPSLRFEFIRLYPGVRSCVLEYKSVNNLRAAETMEFDAKGKVCRVLAHYGAEVES